VVGLKKNTVHWLRKKTARWWGQRVSFELRSEKGPLLINGIYQNLWRSPYGGLQIELSDCVRGTDRIPYFTKHRAKKLCLCFPVRAISRWTISPSVKGFVDVLIKSEEVFSEVLLLGERKKRDPKEKTSAPSTEGLH
jgi:hypothetical protein